MDNGINSIPLDLIFQHFHSSRDFVAGAQVTEDDQLRGFVGLIEEISLRIEDELFRPC
jgi:hypothetical protein